LERSGKCRRRFHIHRAAALECGETRRAPGIRDGLADRGPELSADSRRVLRIRRPDWTRSFCHRIAATAWSEGPSTTCGDGNRLITGIDRLATGRC
jgi:hypothetical protein